MRAYIRRQESSGLSFTTAVLLKETEASQTDWTGAAGTDHGDGAASR